MRIVVRRGRVILNDSRRRVPCRQAVRCSELSLPTTLVVAIPERFAFRHSGPSRRVSPTNRRSGAATSEPDGQVIRPSGLWGPMDRGLNGGRRSQWMAISQGYGDERPPVGP